MAEDFQVSANLVAGSKFVKWDDDTPYGVPVNLYVDRKGYWLYWADQNREMDCIDMSVITDIRTGSSARIPRDLKLRESLKIGPQDTPMQDRMLTISYGPDFSNISFINFSCLNSEIAKEWSAELFRCCHTSRSSLITSCLTQIEKCYFKLTLIRDVDGKIPIKNIVKVFTQNREDKKKVINALEASNLLTNQTDSLESLSFDQFFLIYQNLCFRNEALDIFYSFYNLRTSNKSDRDVYWSVDQLMDFINKEQRDSRLNELLHPMCTLEKAKMLISKYEVDNELISQVKMSQFGFLKFLLSSDNNIVSRCHAALNQNMSHSLSHYFINSSHNTYLTGHQLTSRSSVEMYKQSLLSGCRCVELDCWDGSGSEEEPIVTHGFTMCTQIPLKDVLESIAEAAFKVSEWPVLLSFENHCSPKQQTKIAQYCKSIFADMLLQDPLPSHPLEAGVHLPSPEMLKRKILIKNKKLHPHRNDPMSVQNHQKVKATTSNATKDSIPSSPVFVSSPSSDSFTFLPQQQQNLRTLCRIDSETDSEVEGDSDESKKLPGDWQDNMKSANAERGTAAQEASAVTEMSDLVIYLQPFRFISFGACENKNRSYECTSLVESQARVLLNAFPVEFVNYNKFQMCRIYPRGTRVDSSNFLPQIFWNAGCQTVALNFQTLDLGMQMNVGAFEYNGRSGYLLKPNRLTMKEKHFDPFADTILDGIVPATLIVKIISGQFLSDKRIGTFVTVDLFGLPSDTVRSKFRTRVCTANGINPVYSSSDSFVFNQIIMPQLAYLRFAVYHENGATLLGQRVFPIEHVRPGYRHISLFNERGQPQGMATLFVHLTLKDFVPDSHAEIAAALTNPIAYQLQLSEMMEKHAHQLSVLEENFDSSQLDNRASDQSQLSQVMPTASPSSTTASSSYVSAKRMSWTWSRKKLARECSVDCEEEMLRYSSQHLKSSSSETNITQFASGGISSPGLHLSSSLLLPKNRSRLSDNCMWSYENEFESLHSVTLSSLRENKRHLKVVSKLEKEFFSLKKKHEKELSQRFTQHQQEIKRLTKELQNKESQRQQISEADFQLLKRAKDSQTSDLIQLCHEQEKAELKFKLLQQKNIYESLCQIVEESRESRLYQLEKKHVKSIGSLKKKHDSHMWEQIKLLKDKHKNKNEQISSRRESVQKSISTAVKDRQKLAEMYENQMKLVTTVHDEILQQLSADKFKMEQDLEQSLKRKSISNHERRSLLQSESSSESFQCKVIEETRV